jgi:hypothetical protein
MAAGAQVNPGQITSIAIPVGGATGVGSLSVNPPTFLEKWGVVFVSVGGIWMLAIAATVLVYYLLHLSFPPPQPPQMAATDYKQVLDMQKASSDQFRDSLGFIFDLLVTRTVLPLVTLLLGYLFGSKKT